MDIRSHTEELDTFVVVVVDNSIVRTSGGEGIFEPWQPNSSLKLVSRIASDLLPHLGKKNWFLYMKLV